MNDVIWQSPDDDEPAISGFIDARLSEDRAVANNATWSHWSSMGIWNDDGGRDWCVGVPDQDDNEGRPIILRAVGPNGEFDAHHAARHDPARVIAQTDALRAIATAHQPRWNDRSCPYCGGADSERLGCAPAGHGEWQCHAGCVQVEEHGCATLRSVAAIWADHPDYRREWA